MITKVNYKYNRKCKLCNIKYGSDLKYDNLICPECRLKRRREFIDLGKNIKKLK